VNLKYLSVCSGIEAATVAWHPLGWQAVGFSEIEKFPSEVLAHHYPDVPNLGDMTKFKEWDFGSNVDVFVGGTPCQSFSVAGLRKGLDDPRGNLMLTYLAIAKQYRPRWLVWENVPGVLSSADGRDFGSFLGGLAVCGYGFAYRVLDAQYFGVAQRRKRVFVVGYLGDWRPAAAVLFERESLCGHPAPSREKGQRIAPCVTNGPPFSRTGNERVEAEAMVVMDCGVELSGPLSARDYKDAGTDGMNKISAKMIPTVQPIYAIQGSMIGLSDKAGPQGDGINVEVCFTQNTIDCHAVAYNIAPGKGKLKDDIHVTDAHITKTIDASGSNPAMHQGVAAIVQPIPFDTTQITSKANYSKPQQGDPCHPLAAGAHPPAIVQPIGVDIFNAAFSGEVSVPLTRRSDGTGTGPTVMQPLGTDLYNCTITGNISMTLKRGDGNPAINLPTVMQSMAVRRLTPKECERLQGFPDNYTDIKPKGKATPDGPRYKALGNSMAVPVMAWIGKRIQEVECL
jgi:DNA (cytosine-5)-methyltransferase 1